MNSEGWSTYFFHLPPLYLRSSSSTISSARASRLGPVVQCFRWKVLYLTITKEFGVNMEKVHFGKSLPNLLTSLYWRWRWASRQWWQWWSSLPWSFPVSLPLERDRSLVCKKLIILFIPFPLAGVFFAITLIMTTVITLLEAVITRMYRTARPLPSILKMPTRSTSHQVFMTFVFGGKSSHIISNHSKLQICRSLSENHQLQLVDMFHMTGSWPALHSSQSRLQSVWLRGWEAKRSKAGIGQRMGIRQKETWSSGRCCFFKRNNL